MFIAELMAIDRAISKLFSTDCDFHAASPVQDGEYAVDISLKSSD